MVATGNVRHVTPHGPRPRRNRLKTAGLITLAILVGVPCAALMLYGFACLIITLMTAAD
jgi:hypothetical protein